MQTENSYNKIISNGIFGMIFLLFALSFSAQNTNNSIQRADTMHEATNHFNNEATPTSVFDYSSHLLKSQYLQIQKFKYALNKDNYSAANAFYKNLFISELSKYLNIKPEMATKRYLRLKLPSKNDPPLIS
ncbi:hypothetical protein [Methylophaga sp.]|uniref:hypothetical protein n=1 Tax=Methylophaga sp. TaxID=2024840 RepID=UPI003F6A4C5B